MDWIQLFDDNNVDYVTKGPNTKRGEVSIQCPYCGDDDPSHHLGVSLTVERWGCHRSADHRGRSPVRLIAVVLGCSYTRAKLLERQYSRPDPDNLASALEALEGSEAPAPAKAPPLTLPANFQRIESVGPTSRFYHYITSRGFERFATPSVIDRYALRCATTGRYKDRIIFSFYERSRLMGWTGRAISAPEWAPRYLSSGPEIKETVFNYNAIRLHNPQYVLCVCEGPFDALKLDFYGRKHNLRATCIFGTSMTMDQIWILNRLARNYKHTYVLMDPEAIEASFGAKDWLTHRNVSVAHLLQGIEDPGAMTKDQVEAFADELNRRADETREHLPRRKAKWVLTP